MARRATASLAAASAVVVACAQAAAQPMDKETFLDAMASGSQDARNLVAIHFGGIIDGLEAANSALERRGATPLYCLPPATVVEAGWLLEETHDYLKRFGDIPDKMSVAVVATFVLKDAYPCPEYAGSR